LIREEVDRLVRRSAGFFMGAGIAGHQRTGTVQTPPGLGDDDGELPKENEEYDKEQEKPQWFARVEKRRAGKRR
jgi:hypothetical protein